MPRYFEHMPQVGKPMKKANPENEAQLKAIEAEIHELIKAAQSAGRSDESLNESGQLTALQRVEKLVEPGTFRPLNTLYNPEGNKNGSVSIVKGLGRINGKWAVIVASDNKKLAGAWVPGQAECLLRASDTAKTLRIPLVYVLNCSGVKFDEQEKVYPNRRGGGTPFFRNAELNQLGIPVIVGIYGTNPAGGGYHSISPTILIAHEKANMAVGGAGILGGMSPKGYIDMEGAEQIAESVAKSGKTEPLERLISITLKRVSSVKFMLPKKVFLKASKNILACCRATIRNSSVLTIRKHRPCLWMTSTPWFR